MPDNLMQAARKLAERSAKSEPNITEIYLFPAKKEVRLIEVDRTALPSGKRMAIYYFAPNTDIPFPSGIALIPPQDKGIVSPPRNWGTWDKAIKIWP